MTIKNKSSGFDESGNWNSAKRFSDVKIMQRLEDLDTYEFVALEGFFSLKEKINNPQARKKEINWMKLQGFTFLVNGLVLVMENSEFAVKILKDEFKKYYKVMLLIQQEISVGKQIEGEKEAILNKDYKKILLLVKKIKAKLNNSLNKNSLIFMSRKQFDVKEAKANFMEEVTTQS